MTSDRRRLDAQLAFLSEVDALRRVLRMTRIVGGERRENSAEHSWHMAVMAIVLAEHAPDGVDVLRAVKMTLIHDIVEIDAGDTFAFDESAHHDKEERERLAAERLFGMLPEDQAATFREVWDEFEVGTTPTARFANALDRLSGCLMNYHNDGGTWVEHDVSLERIFARQAPIREGAPALWPEIERMVAEVMGG